MEATSINFLGQRWNLIEGTCKTVECTLTAWSTVAPEDYSYYSKPMLHLVHTSTFLHT